jgi:hypothetical protein
MRNATINKKGGRLWNPKSVVMPAAMKKLRLQNSVQTVAEDTFFRR